MVEERALLPQRVRRSGLERAVTGQAFRPGDVEDIASVPFPGPVQLACGNSLQLCRETSYVEKVLLLRARYELILYFGVTEFVFGREGKIESETLRSGTPEAFSGHPSLVVKPTNKAHYCVSKTRTWRSSPSPTFSATVANVHKA